MKANTQFIKKQFKNIADTYNLEWKHFDDDYGGRLMNESVDIMVGTERYEEGVHLSLENLKNNHFYYPEDIEEAFGFNNFDSFLTSSERIE